MDIGPSDPQAGHPTMLDECHRLVVTDHQRRRKRGEQLEHLATLLQQTEADLTYHVGVAQHFAGLQMCGQNGVMATQMVHPDRGIDENHLAVRRVGRRRAMTRRRGSEPPSAASLRALSRAISARSPSCTSALFSCMPVTPRALATKSSSKIRVVRICMSMATGCIC